MARYESAEPVPFQVDDEHRAGARVHDRPAGNPVVDPLLWRDAQRMLDRHAAAGQDGRCEWCGWQWPCPPRRLAERAEVASRRLRVRPGPPATPSRESWTARHDLNGLRGLPGLRAQVGRRTNIGLFD